ncbi:MAG TPA: flagellar FlbD family protein [Nocardioidaceae bacterium]|nr:flagellar FlbD family protein [Nocardioidaceae bacterium]
MVTLTRLAGSVFALNPDLIERVDSTPDTVITLLDGKKYLVRESLAEVVEAVRRYRGSVVAEAHRFETTDAAPTAPLRSVPGAPDDATVVRLPRGDV